MRPILIGVSILGFLLSTSNAEADRKTEELLMVAGATADLVSTEVGLARGLREANPLGQKRWQRVTLKTVGIVSGIYFARKLENAGHDRLARGVRYLHIGVGFGAATWNVQATIRWGK